MLSFMFKGSVNILFGSVISLQILAHLPLTNISLPANAMECFDIMVKVVSFDYFPIAQIFDFGFTKTEPWSWNFEYLDYESSNFIEVMGSIILSIWIIVLFCIALCICEMVRNRRGKDKTCCQRKIGCGPMKTWYFIL